MPLAAIPFKSPPPFELHPMMAEPIRQPPWATAARHALDLLVQIDAGEALAVAATDPSGRLILTATHGAVPEAEAALEAWTAAPAPEAAEDGFLGRVLRDSQPLLFMGAATPEEGEPLPAPMRSHLLAGGQLGFLYVYPAGSDAALMIHRPLAAGPLNHDQPAIAQAVAGLLGDARAAGA